MRTFLGISKVFFDTVNEGRREESGSQSEQSFLSKALTPTASRFILAKASRNFQEAQTVSKQLALLRQDKSQTRSRAKPLMVSWDNSLDSGNGQGKNAVVEK